MEQSLFRKKSLAQISSPDQMDEYMRVTNPSVWMLLLAAAILITGLVVWGIFASFDSFASGTGTVKNGKMTIQLDDPALAGRVQVGMKVRAGETETTVSSVGRTADGSAIVTAGTELADGTYPVKIFYKTTQVISLLTN